MLKRMVFSAICAAALLVPGITYAQAGATLTLRSGETVTGNLVDLGGVGYTIRVDGKERQIPQNDVAVIDFTNDRMSAADWAKFTGSSQIVLRNGKSVDGSLYDIGGTNPLRLTVKTSEGEREFSSSEVARIILAKPANVATATSGTPAQASVAGTITVPANQPWTSTGITVRKGQPLTFRTSGDVHLSGEPNDVANAGGKPGRFAPNAPVKQAPAGTLIGRIGDGAPFAIGTRTRILAPASGVLFLGVNDDGFNDNSGNFEVIVR